ncbi:hypothetical protein RHMOL_Rhmol11G0021000 [Rhododendron molle]|uniref:Uncharacterized protein n=1 Tax=Rhododendron molle TaxID=49168 RepID=A0ACC0LNT3_RHOML|nr:hypothetical protein RHMOL_Rhmol11G0021000 [Rhododendron molle]
MKLPLEFWTTECFSKIARTIGKPLHVDQATAKKLRLDYARVCVEIDVGTDLPDDVQITINGEAVIVALQYQWLPPICTNCKVFGHPKGTCFKQPGTKVSSQRDIWQVVGKGKGKRDANSATMVTGKSSTSQSAIEDSNGIPSVLADLSNSIELQPITTFDFVHNLSSEIVVKDSVDKGMVAKGPVVHVVSNNDNGRQMAASDQSVLGQGDATSGPRSSSNSIETIVTQALSDELSDSEDELLEVLERVVSSNQMSQTLVHLNPPASLDVGSSDSHTPQGKLGLGAKGRAAEKVPTGGSVINKSLSKFAQKRLRKLAKEQCGGAPFYATFVYGANSYLSRQALWSSLHQSSTPHPWVVLGDFNAIRFPNEKSGGSSSWPPYMDEFNDCLFALELDDLKFSGCFFTWANKQDPAHHVTTRLDMVLVNEQWMKDYSCSSAHFPKPGISDHSPGIVCITPSPRKSTKPFKFFDFIADHPQFFTVVQQVWRKVIIGNPMFCVSEKLKLLQRELKFINNRDFSDVSKRVVDTRQLLESLQKDLGSQPSNSFVISKEKEVHRQLLTLLRAKESLATQKSRIQWLKLGDQCTSYFFKAQLQKQE